MRTPLGGYPRRRKHEPLTQQEIDDATDPDSGEICCHVGHLQSVGQHGYQRSIPNQRDGTVGQVEAKKPIEDLRPGSRAIRPGPEHVPDEIVHDRQLGREDRRRHIRHLSQFDRHPQSAKLYDKPGCADGVELRPPGQHG
ncbi:MAG TPA: hypothetical protein VH701_19855 [Vicinamibacterales bacterium]